MSDLLALLERLSGFGANTLVPALVLIASAIVVLRRWQATLPLMIVFYCVLTLVLTLVLPPGVALLYGAGGIISSLVLSVAAQRAGVEPAAPVVRSGRQWSLRRLSTPLLLRATGTLFVLLISIGFVQRFPLLGTLRALEFAAIMLFALGVFLLAITRDALAHGQAMLITLAGVGIGSAGLDPSASVATLLAFVTLLLAGVSANLTLADRSEILEENRRA
jgi:hypothetical protein